MSVVGYARVSTSEQTTDLQLDAIATHNPVRVFTEHASTRGQRPQLAALLDYVRAGDVVVVWKLDRLGRSVPEIIQTCNTLSAAGVELQLLTEQLDTATVGGRLMFHILAALAEAERDLISERTKAGLAAAAARGRHPGRPTVLSAERRETITSMRNAGASHARIARDLGIGASTVARALRDTHPTQSPPPPQVRPKAPGERPSCFQRPDTAVQRPAGPHPPRVPRPR